MPRHYRITIYGNCQRVGLQKILERLLPKNKYVLSSYLNTPRAGVSTDDDELERVFSDSDIIIYQPLSESHYYNEEKMASFQAQKIRFAYIFNNGIAGLIHAPLSERKPYGQIFGEDTVLNHIQDNSLQQLLEIYQAGEMKFNLVERFSHCIAEMARREKALELNLSPFIAENYQKIPLFITHNHPTFPVFHELGRQVCTVLGESPNSFSDWLNAFCYNCAGVAISPFDAEELGYEFGYHAGWFENGKRMIEMIYNAHVHNMTEFDRTAVDPLPFPDSLIMKRGQICIDWGRRDDDSTRVQMLHCHILSKIVACDVLSDDFVAEISDMNLPYFDFHYKMGLHFFKKNDLDRSEDYLNEAIKLDSRRSEGALYFLSNVFFRKGKLELAARTIAAAIRIHKNPPYYQLFGLILFRLKRLGSAERVLKKGLSLNPAMGMSFYFLSKIYETRREFQTAELFISKALSLDKENSLFKDTFDRIRKLSHKGVAGY